MPFSGHHPARRLLALLVLAVLGLACGTGVSSAEPPAPPDAFYDRPAGLDAYQPGQVIRSRPVTVRALQLLPVAVQAWQLLYRTADAQGRPDAAVTTVMVPHGPAQARPLLSYQAATDSTLRVCAPSYSLVHGAPIDFAAPTGPLTLTLPGAEMLFVAAGLAQGWAVTMPDHGGLDDRFLTPHQPGYAVLDSIRAAQSFTPLGLAGPGTPTALWGYSGGAIASSWAVEEQPGYAPELNIVGAAIGAPERDLEASLRAANQKLLAGLIPIALASMGKDSPEFAAELDQYLTPSGREIVARARNHCAAQNVLSNLLFDYNLHLTVPVEQALANPVIRREIDVRSVTGRAPTVPTYVYNGVSEEVAPVSGTDKLVASYCAGGAPVTYRREIFPQHTPLELLTTHGTVVATGGPGALAWLTQRLAPGAPPVTAGCDIQTVPSTLLAPDALAVGLPPLLQGVLGGLTGAPLGVGAR